MLVSDSLALVCLAAVIFLAVFFVQIMLASARRQQGWKPVSMETTLVPLQEQSSEFLRREQMATEAGSTANAVILECRR